MCLDDELRCCCLKAYTTLDAYDGVADVAVATYGVACSYLFNFLDSLDLIVELLSVDGCYLALLECYAECCLTCFR